MPALGAVCICACVRACMYAYMQASSHTRMTARGPMSGAGGGAVFAAEAGDSDDKPKVLERQSTIRPTNHTIGQEVSLAVDLITALCVLTCTHASARASMHVCPWRNMRTRPHAYTLANRCSDADSLFEPLTPDSCTLLASVFARCSHAYMRACIRQYMRARTCTLGCRHGHMHTRNALAHARAYMHMCG